MQESCNKLTAEVYVHSIIILNKWAAGLEKMTHPKPEHILLPRYYKIVERSTCSESMRLEVDLLLARSSSIAIISNCPNS